MYHLTGIQTGLDGGEEVRFLICARFAHVILVSGILGVSTEERNGEI